MDLPHELGPDLPQAAVPDNVELGVLLLQLAQLRQQLGRVTALGRTKPVGHHRLQKGWKGAGFYPQALARVGLGEAQYGADATGRGLRTGLKFGAGIEAELFDLFLQPLPAGQAVRQGRAHPQAAAGDL